MTAEEIKEFNDKVEYNNSIASWVCDIFTTLIFWPMIFIHIYRRCKYDELIEL